MSALDSFDQDGNGRLSSAEYGNPTPLQIPFGDGDLDGDGYLDVGEWRDMILRSPPRFQRDLKPKRREAMLAAQSKAQSTAGDVPIRARSAQSIRSLEEVAQVRGLLQRRSMPPKAADTPNILIVGMDTTRADRMSVYGHDRDTTPNLRRFAKKGVVFEQSIANSNESLYSHANLWTAQYASEIAKPVYETFVLPEAATTMAEVLKVYGYETAGFVAGGHLDADFGHAQGFDSYEAQVGFGSFWSTVPQALKWIDGRTEQTPWMAFVHGYDAHAPYRTAAPFGHRFYQGEGPHPTDELMSDPQLAERIYKRTFYPGRSLFFDHPKGFRILSTGTYDQVAEQTSGVTIPFGEENIAHLKSHYDGCLAYADLQIGLLLTSLENRGLLSNTVVIIVGDHGEDLLDHDFVNHRTGLYDSIIRVPMIAAGPGFPAGLRVDGLVQALDLLPTVLKVAGAQVPVGSRGRPLQDVVTGDAPELDVVFSEGVMDMLSVRTKSHKLIARGFALAAPELVSVIASTPMDADRFALYDLQADPGERDNLLLSEAPQAKAIAESLRAKMLKWRVELAIGAAALDPSRVDPAVAEQLRLHGYWRSVPSDGG
mgnify:CR=1 FL=1